MSEQRKMKNYEELKFNDNFMFCKVMDDRSLCREVLQCLLQRPVGELTEGQIEKEIRYVEGGKPIRLDVYNEEDSGTVYDTEMQNLNHKSVEALHLPKRSRFYQSSIDTDYLNKTNSFSRLPDSYVIFICTFDPFGEGLDKYTFRERCDEKQTLTLDDGTCKIFFNCCYKGEEITEDLRMLYEYVETGNAGNELTKKIDNAVTKARNNEQWRLEYLRERVLLGEAREEGREEGIKEGGDIRDNERISNMLRRGKTVDEIVDFCGYPKEQVEKVEKSMLTPSE